jgi:hypothetical protein
MQSEGFLGRGITVCTLHLLADCLDSVRTSTSHIRVALHTAGYGDIFIFLYVGGVRTSQESHLWAYTVSYGDSFTLLICR